MKSNEDTDGVLKIGRFFTVVSFLKTSKYQKSASCNDKVFTFFEIDTNSFHSAKSWIYCIDLENSILVILCIDTFSIFHL